MLVLGRGSGGGESLQAGNQAGGGGGTGRGRGRGGEACTGGRRVVVEVEEEEEEEELFGTVYARILQPAWSKQTSRDLPLQ